MYDRHGDLDVGGAHEGDSTAMDVVPLQISIRDIAEARRFYREVIGCGEGLSDQQRLMFNLHGHQIVCGLDPKLGRRGKLPAHFSPRTGRFEPDVRCAVALEMEQWNALSKRLRQCRAEFEISLEEQATLLLLDPSGNAFEFKASRATAERFLRRQRARAAARVISVILAAMISGWLVLQARNLADELPLKPAVCPIHGFCAP